MATLTVVNASIAGVDMTGAACAGGGDQWANSGQEILQFVNGSGGSINVTVATQATVDGMGLSENVVAVGAGATKTIGPFPPGRYNDGSGYAQITYSGVTSLTVKVLKVPPA